MMTYEEILKKLDDIDPIKYAKTRNFSDGAVTWLSPYISRGFLDTRTILEHLLRRGYKYHELEKFVQQMAWREFFQRVWQAKGEQINRDLRNDQQAKFSQGMPLAVVEHRTGIHAIDTAISRLHTEGNMHNHLRMYVAFICANLGGYHWRDPARWMYYHLLDGDWASNALSWQWVAGTFSQKKYIANQENINRYTKSSQWKTFLDLDYDTLAESETPEVLKAPCLPEWVTPLPENKPLTIDPSRPTLVYNYYNLSPTWRKDEDANRVLLLEPDVFARYPVSGKCIEFALALSNHIPGIQVFVGSFHALQSQTGPSSLIYREHPLNRHYRGICDERVWMLSEPSKAEGSFFSFWKKYERQLRKMYFS